MFATESICPRIISRREWGARNSSGLEPLWTSPTPYVVVHHGGILHYCYDQTGCSEIVRSYQDLHMDKNHWLDIGYQFVIGEDSNVYEGRGWDAIGAHSPGYNSQSIGVSIIGDFSRKPSLGYFQIIKKNMTNIDSILLQFPQTDFLPNDGALRALDSLIACGVAMGKISRNYQVIGHRQARDTVCPGETFYKYVMKMPRWTANPVPVCMSNCAAKPISQDYNNNVALVPGQPSNDTHL